MSQFANLPEEIQIFILRLVYLNSDDKFRSSVTLNSTCKLFKRLHSNAPDKLCPLSVTFDDSILKIATNQTFENKMMKMMLFLPKTEMFNKICEGKYKVNCTLFADNEDKHNMQLEKKRAASSTEYLTDCKKIISILTHQGYITLSNANNIHTKILHEEKKVKPSDSKFLNCTIS